jgi:hypothetical protein
MIRKGLAGIALAAVGTVVWAQGAVSPEQRWAQVVACVSQGSSDGRHACIDAVLRAAGVLDPVQELAQQRTEFGRTERDLRAQQAPAPAVAPVPSPAPAPVAPTSAAPVQAAPAPIPAQPAAPAPLPDRIDSISTTIAAARIAGNNRLLVATAEATVWRQLEGETFRVPPSAGTPFEVRRGALGGYICTVGRGNSYRCARVD